MKLKYIIKKGVGEERVRHLQSAKLWARISLLRSVGRSRILSKLYVLLFSTDYDREINAVVNGHIRFLENRAGTEATNYHLRRCVHRLEKGLSMPVMKSAFGLDYIEETIESFRKSTISYMVADPVELRWAKDVLDKYFSVCQGPEVVERSRARYANIIETSIFSKTEMVATPLIPYPEKKRVGAPISYDSMMALAQWRRSVRWYQDKPVPRELIDKAVAAAAFSPSACNRQPFEFRIIDDRELLKATRELPMGVKGFSEGFPMMVAIMGKLRAYPEVRDRHVIYVDGGLAAMTFMYALESLGLSSCPINWPDIESREKAAEKVLNMTKDERIVMWLSVGYAEESGYIPYSAKLSVDSLRRFN